MNSRFADIPNLFKWTLAAIILWGSYFGVKILIKKLFWRKDGETKKEV
jgi:hypothetical protein